MQVRGSLSHRHAGCDRRAQEKWQCLRSPCQFSFPVRGGGPAEGPGPSCCCCRHCEPRASTHLSGVAGRPRHQRLTGNEQPGEGDARGHAEAALLVWPGSRSCPHASCRSLSPRSAEQRNPWGAAIWAPTLSRLLWKWFRAHGAILTPRWLSQRRFERTGVASHEDH